MKKLTAILCFALSLALGSFGTSAAGRGCYTAHEYEAEQGLRIHSELMVIGLTCLKMPGGRQIYDKYARFTQKNQSLIAEYETEMIGYYRHEGAPNPEKNLHTLRTNLANDISKHAIQMSTASFCQAFSSRVDQALAMDQSKIRKWAQQVWPKTPASHPVCPRR